MFLTALGNVKHDGQTYEIGDVFECNADQAQALIDLGVARVAKQRGQQTVVTEAPKTEEPTAPTTGETAPDAQTQDRRAQ